jgi:hypothetical protein
VAEVGLELCCDQFDGFWACFEGCHEIEKDGEGEVVLCDATNSICRWVTITTLVHNRQYHLTQGEAPPHVEERETPNRDNSTLKTFRS